MTVGGNDLSELFSVIMIIGFEKAGEPVDGTGSILGGGTPVSRSKGTSSRPVAVDRALIGGPASSGGCNAFSPNPGRGSVGLGMTGGVLVMTGPGWTSSFFAFATCASHSGLRVIRF